MMVSLPVVAIVTVSVAPAAKVVGFELGESAPLDDVHVTMPAVPVVPILHEPAPEFRMVNVPPTALLALTLTAGCPVVRQSREKFPPQNGGFPSRHSGSQHECGPPQ